MSTKMALWQARPKRTASNGIYHAFRKKRSREVGSDPTLPKVSVKQTKKNVRTRGGGQFTRILTADKINLMVSPGKFKISKIKTVKENPANRHFSRMNVLTKGAVIDTDDGLARVTSKPARHGVVNAILIK